MPKIFKSGNSKVVTIPEEVLKTMGLKAGDEVVLKAKKDRIELLPTQKNRIHISQDFAKWTEEFITRYKSTLDELAKK